MTRAERAAFALAKMRKHIAAARGWLEEARNDRINGELEFVAGDLWSVGHFRREAMKWYQRYRRVVNATDPARNFCVPRMEVDC